MKFKGRLPTFANKIHYGSGVKTKNQVWWINNGGRRSNFVVADPEGLILETSNSKEMAFKKLNQMERKAGK